MSGNRTLYGDDRTYPKGLTDIPLASYFKITRYQYNDGLKSARESGQNDASTGLSNIAPITNKINKVMTFFLVVQTVEPLRVIREWKHLIMNWKH